LDEYQYRLLCEACDRALLAPDSTAERVAISWLHIIREHPVFLANYADLFKSATDISVFARRWRRILRNRAGWYRQIARALRSDGKPWSGPKEMPRQVDVLFVSHLLNESHAGNSNDFYYGNLPDELGAHGYTAAIALINYSSLPGEVLVGKWNESDVPRIILSSTLGIAEEHAIQRRMKQESRQLRKLAKTETPSLYRKVLAQASQEALSSGSRATLRIATQIKELVAKLRPKAIVVTHEGHAWERVVFAKARGVIPEIQCIGYQHAAVFRMQHAIRRNLMHRYNPEKILTSGTASKSQLENAPGLEEIEKTVLGSNRSFQEARTDVAGAADQMHAAHAEITACLVLPEGLAVECHRLFEFSLVCAQICPDVQFIWRLHPILTFETLASQNQKLRNLPSNVVLSRSTLEDDLAVSRWALYRGTTAVFQAVMAGLRPIYLQQQGEMTIDPLYELDVWRTIIANVQEFQQIIRNDIGSSEWPPKTDIASARRYCRSYFLPLNVVALTALIECGSKKQV
jgi:hypothetical protein